MAKCGSIKGVLVETSQGNFILDPADKGVSRSLMEYSQYGRNEISRATELISAVSEVLILGAHIGAIAVPLSRRCHRLVAVEANPYTYDLLQINIILNQCKNVETFNVAASNCDEHIQFVLNTHNSGGSKRMPIYRDYIYFYDRPEITTVLGARIDGLLQGRRFDLVFMDIEGSEYFALQGMPLILESAEHLVVEFLPHHLSRVAGVTLAEFLDPISKNFAMMIVPSLGLRVRREQFYEILHAMFLRKQGDSGLIFSKTSQ